MDSEKENHCVVCGHPSKPKKKLLYDVGMVKGLLAGCKEKLDCGDLNVKPLYDKLIALNDDALERVGYHSECRKPYVHKRKSAGSSAAVKPLGRLSKNQLQLTAALRAKRVKTVPLEECCMFKSCSICKPDPNDKEASKLIICLSDEIGITLVGLKRRTSSDQVRSCVSDLHEMGDARALEKRYHRNCLVFAKRTMVELKNPDLQKTSLLESLCDN